MGGTDVRIPNLLKALRMCNHVGGTPSSITQGAILVDGCMVLCLVTASIHVSLVSLGLVFV